MPTLTEDLSEVDGFGVNADAYFRFGRSFDPDQLPAPGDVGAAMAAGFVVLGTAPRPVPAVLTTTDGTLFPSPLTPLPPRSEVVAYVTRALTAAAGGMSRAFGRHHRAPRVARRQHRERGGGAHRARRHLERERAPRDHRLSHAVDPRRPARGRGGRRVAFARCVGAFVAGDYRDASDSVLRRAAGAAATPVATCTIRSPPGSRSSETARCRRCCSSTGSRAIASGLEAAWRSTSHRAPADVAAFIRERPWTYIVVSRGDAAELSRFEDDARWARMAAARYLELGTERWARWWRGEEGRVLRGHYYIGGCERSHNDVVIRERGDVLEIRTVATSRGRGVDAILGPIPEGATDVPEARADEYRGDPSIGPR